MSGKLPKICAQTIKNLLAVKHAKDVFVEECKTGPTWTANQLGILDGWAMKKSWANLCTWGYEVKVSRSDFVNDDKWPGYLPFCNQFYFVCPSGLISVEETPQDAGLMWVSKTGTRLYTKKKAPHRAGDPEWALLAYILFWRAKIDVKYDQPEVSDREFWTKWLEQKKIDKSLGYRVGKVLQQTVKQEILDARTLAEKQTKDIERLTRVKETMTELGLYPSYHDSPDVRRRAQVLSAAMPQDLMRKLSAAETALANVQDSIKQAVLEVAKP